MTCHFFFFIGAPNKVNNYVRNYKSIHRIIYFQVTILSLQWPLSPGELHTLKLPITLCRGNPSGLF